MRQLKTLPPSNTGRYERAPNAAHLKIVAKLKSHPGTWYEVRTFNTVSAAGRYARKIRTSQFIAFKGSKYEASARGTTVFARYLGDE